MGSRLTAGAGKPGAHVAGDAPGRPVLISLTAAAQQVGRSYAALRALAVDRQEFAVVRDFVGKGFQIYLRRDEVAAFAAGSLRGLRRFRARPKSGGRSDRSVTPL